MLCNEFYFVENFIWKCIVVLVEKVIVVFVGLKGLDESVNIIVFVNCLYVMIRILWGIKYNNMICIN